MDKKAQAAEKFKERTASKRFKLPEGNTTFRVMPNAKGLDKAEYIEYAMHSNVGARNAYLRCGKNMRGEGDCWLCDTLIPKLEKSSKSSHKKAAEALKRKECFAVQIIFQSEGKWVGPTLWEMSPSVANKLLNVMSRRDVSHPEKGYNLTISRTGTTMTSTKYGDIDRDDEKSEVPEKLLAKLKPFGEALRKYDEKVMKTEYYGHEQDDDEPEDEEEETTKKKADDDEGEEEETPKKKKKSSDDEDESEEEEKPKKKKKDEDEEEEEETPKSKKKKDEDEEESSEEEEEETPKKKKKPVDADEDEEEEEKPKSKKKKDEDEDEETEEEIPDLEEEEEDKPKSKKKKDKDEEEESESEEDEEEEKPKSKKKSSDEDEEEEEKPKSKKKASRDEDDE